VFDEVRLLIQFVWMLVAPAFGHYSDATLVALGIGLAIVAAVGVALLLVAAIIGRRGSASAPCAPRLLAQRARPRPRGPRLLRLDARPRAPGAVLV
jgi:hypothetical protein